MMQRALEAELGILRVTIESQLGHEALVLVTSATSDDGAEEVANRLAWAFAAAGRRSVIVSIGQRDAAGSGGDGRAAGIVRSLAPVCEDLDAISVPLDGVSSSKALGDFVHDIRERYDAVVIEAGAVTSHGVALQLASSADAVLLTVRLGRSEVDADAAVMPLLARVGARVMGMVTTTSAARRRVRAVGRPASAPSSPSASGETALHVAAKV